MIALTGGATPWGNKLRGALAFWALLSAVFSPILTGYRFLAGRGNVPGTGSAGVLAIVVNSCILTTLLLTLGGLGGYAFIGLVTRAEAVWKNIVKAVLQGLLGWWMLLQPGLRGIGVLFLAGTFCMISPVWKWIERNILVAAGICGVSVVVAMLAQPSSMQDWWTDSGRHHAVVSTQLVRVDGGADRGRGLRVGVRPLSAVADRREVA